MFEAIERGEIKALWVMATNPAVSLPRAGAMRDALKKLELFVVSENVASNDTLNAGAHILLPAAAWGEKDGTVTNSERRISRQRALPAAARRGEAGLVDRRRKSRGAWVLRDAFAYADPPPTFSASTPRCRRSRMTARAISIIGALAEISDAVLRRARSGRLAGPRRRSDDARASSPTAASSRPTARRASSRRKSRRCAATPSDDYPVRAQHRPRARPVAHHDAHGPEPAARPAHARAVRRGASGRCGGAWP